MRLTKTAAMLAALIALSFGLPAAAADGDPAQGKIKAYNCLGCHGIPGYHNVYPTYKVPRLGGQHAAYLEASLKAYRDGNRSHPTMQAQGGSLSDQDIADIAAWFAVAPVHKDDNAVVVGGDAEKGKELAATCTACHGPTGAADNDQYPIIAGQYGDYLARTLEGYKTGRRNNAIMKGFAANLSEQDMKDLAAWFTQQESPLYVPSFPK